MSAAKDVCTSGNLDQVPTGHIGTGVWATALFVMFIWDRMDQQITQPMPSGLVGWMVQAVQKHRGGGRLVACELKDWAFGLWPNDRVGITFVGHPDAARTLFPRSSN